MTSISERMAASGGYGPNFDVIRLVAASAVLVSHAFPITMGDNRAEPLFRLTGGDLTLGTLAVGIFFATSGFLVTASMDRSSTTRVFAWRRAVRILPALVAVVLLTAFAIGPLLSSSPDYFAHIQTYRYLSNIVFIFDPHLPGVFLNNPLPGAVNGSLWTLFHEVACYIALAATWRAGLYRQPLSYVIAFVLAITAAVALEAFSSGPLLKVQQFCALASYFLGGTLLYLFRARVPLTLPLVAAASVVLLAGTLFGGAKVVPALCVPYIAIFAGFQKEWVKLPGDYSYGIYVWAFPVQQALVQLLPGMGPLTNMAMAAPIVLALGAVSWIMIEKPGLRLKALAKLPIFGERGRA